MARCRDRGWLFVVFAVLMAPSPALAQPRDIAPLLTPILEAHKVPGMAAAVVEGDHVVMIGAAGVRAAGKPEAATIDDLWHLGSCTKSMTASLCAMLVEDGRLRWDQTIAESFPDLADEMDPGWKKATLRQLVTNRAGVPADLSMEDLWGRLWRSNEPPARARLLLIEGVTQRPPLHEPGTTYLYSNAGFAIAGAMAERAAGEPYESLIQRRLFGPLGITTAGFGPPGLPGLNIQPKGHRNPTTPLGVNHDADNPFAIAPAGLVHMSIGDWAKYVSWHLRADAENPRRGLGLLKAETFDTLHTPPEGGDYAAGWMVTSRPWGDGRVLTHSGSNTAWYCVTWAAPKRDFAVLVCCNIGQESGAKGTDAAAWALIQEFQKSKAQQGREAPATTPGESAPVRSGPGGR
ncbi:MAG: hypothetical protein HBSAPP03_17460 [Phycisphaerae bacterium]|nr:MAG: hypothetical protein HBSAPP03_17460 [Phycisphaerae bacterium]